MLAFAVALAAGALAFLRLGPWGVPDSPHVYIALALGAGLSGALWAGLLALSFHSNARGYDDAAASDD